MYACVSMYVSLYVYYIREPNNFSWAFSGKNTVAENIKNQTTVIQRYKVDFPSRLNISVQQANSGNFLSSFKKGISAICQSSISL